MKDWIKQILRENLNELTPKPEFGAGAYHTVFSSRANPNVLYKIGYKDTVDEWIDIFRNYPALFPKVYRSFQSRKDPDFWIVEIEKLDTQRAKQEFEILDNFFYKLRDSEGGNLTPKNFFMDENSETLEYLLTTYKPSHNMLEIIKTWRAYLKKVDPIIKTKKAWTDYHSENFAYDKQGNLKAIDI